MFQEGSRGPAYISYVLEQDYVRVPSRGECEDPECLTGGCLVQVYLDNYQAVVGGEAVVVRVGRWPCIVIWTAWEAPISWDVRSAWWRADSGGVCPGLFGA